MALLSEGSNVKKSPEDKQTSAPFIRGSTLIGGGHIFCKIRTGVVILTNPSFLGPSWTIFTVLSGTHFSLMLIFLQVKIF